MAEKLCYNSKDKDDKSRINGMSRHSCDIPSFVEIDDGIPKRRSDRSDNDSYNDLRNGIVHNGAVSSSAVSMGEAAISSLIEVYDENNYCNHYQETTVGSPKKPFESSLSLQYSMIDSSNIESLTVATDGHDNALDSGVDQKGVKSFVDARDEMRLHTRPNNYDNIHSSLLGSSSSHGEQINTNHYDTNCFTNVGKHLGETGSIDTGAVSNSAQHQSADAVNAAEDLLSPHVVPADVKSSSLSSGCSTFFLPFIAIAALILSTDWGLSEDAFEADISVEVKPVTLRDDIAAKMNYHILRHGTETNGLMENIHISHGYAVDLLGFQTEEESNFESGGCPQNIVRNLSTIVLILCACLILLQTFLRGEIARAFFSLKEPDFLSSPLRLKRCTREVSSLEGTPAFSSTYEHEITRTDGSKAKVRRSARNVLSSHTKEIQTRIKKQYAGMSVNLADEFEAIGNGQG